MTPSANSDDTEDTLLGGKVRLRQPRYGERAAIDPVILAAAVAARSGQRALEMGSGTGAAALCLAWRVPGLHVVALERQADLAAMARQNIALNGFTDRMQAVCADLRACPFPSHGFDHVLANPPYFREDGHSPSPYQGKRAAHQEATDTSCADWIAAAAGALKPKGRLTLIQHAGRLPELMAALQAHEFGDIRVIPLWPRKNRAAIRVLVGARWRGKGMFQMLPGLVLHEGQGAAFTPPVRSILEQGRALSWETEDV